MPNSDIQSILLHHNQWATEQILDACSKLTEEQYHRRFEIGPGSLHNTTTHIAGAMRVWNDLLSGREVGPRIEQDGKRRTPAEVKAVFQAAVAELNEQAGRLPLSQIVTRVREGKTYHFTRGVVLAHVTTHGMHHRAQCLNMLRQLGVSPLPPSSVTEWSWMADAG